jgi:GNAT superfamily N-acetyltransferase
MFLRYRLEAQPRKARDARVNTYTSAPTQLHLDQIHAWLEDEDPGQSFICNWPEITDAFQDGRLHCVIDGGEPIAFAVHDRRTICSELKFMCVHRAHRRKGIGRDFAPYLFSSLSALGTLVVELMCAPPESEQFWRNVGFEDVPTAWDRSSVGGVYRGNVRLMKYLIDRLRVTPNAALTSSLDLWQTDFSSGPPSCTWELPRRETNKWTLSSPILYPCKRDWIVRIVEDGVTRYKGKVKYLFEDYRFSIDDYLYIKEFGIEDFAPQHAQAFER